MAKVIMIQGTMSNAGKSLVTAGLCRIFKQDGYKVAPFKSQNMALNSYITKEGLEIGRAQAMQAEACGIEPHVNMNPILLKPTGDMYSQVIVNGEVRSNTKAMDYFKHKKKLIPHIMAALKALEEKYDVIVIEGAGSPAEINLKQDDIVNMGMAKLANAPVLLVGDIDRGGVFAQLIGTLILLEPEEQDRIKGLIINKFRGDLEILKPGLRMLEERCHKEVLGVIPYMQVDIDDEDSLSERLNRKKVTGLIDIAIIKFPRISNFTDFNALETIAEFSVRYVMTPQELGKPHMIILPGTKNTMEDLQWMRDTGLENLIHKAVKEDTLIWGICGGYQMLGTGLSDPFMVEGGNRIKGMNLLPMETVFAKEKSRTLVIGKIETVTGAYKELSGCTLEGYEIHMGQSKFLEPIQNFARIQTENQASADSRLDGVVTENICGTYIHGIFDTPSILTALQKILCEREHILPDVTSFKSRRDYKEEQYNKLAAIIRENIDMEKIYDIMFTT